MLECLSLPSHLECANTKFANVQLDARSLSYGCIICRFAEVDAGAGMDKQVRFGRPSNGEYEVFYQRKKLYMLG